MSDIDWAALKDQVEGTLANQVVKAMAGLEIATQ